MSIIPQIRPGLGEPDDDQPVAVGILQRATYSLTEQSIQLVPVFAQLGSWGIRHRQTTFELRVRAQLLEDGGPELWTDFMDELRETHLGLARPETGREPVEQRLAAAFAAACAVGSQSS